MYLECHVFIYFTGPYASSCFSVHIGLLDGNVTGNISGLSSWGEGWAGEVRRELLSLVQVDGQVGGQFFQQVHTLSQG